ncbi:hypothetical protein [Streptomyces thermolilacinus]|uniref:Uncharacterized protein n=1 Tax=Streptomyces thermolilacinus SPC6 TaxID=1306406 RepID=A0A1D3E092_9ACTN|nr:hypothetical protein [Streptomyces thermolilacinus]OEJ97987.1 hypothetical protein J116_010605 [Streptomyces thermolilacinus SPC6]
MDLLDWHRGRLSSRRLAVLVRHLPRDSALAREVHGDAAEWGVTDYLLATAVDQLAEANWMFATVNQDEDAEPLEYPTPLPRPGSGDSGAAGGADAPEDGTATPGPAELARFFS